MTKKSGMPWFSIRWILVIFFIVFCWLHNCGLEALLVFIVGRAWDCGVEVQHEKEDGTVSSRQ